MNAQTVNVLEVKCFLPYSSAPAAADDPFERAIDVIGTAVGIAAGADAEQALRGSTGGLRAMLPSVEVSGWSSAQADAIHRLVTDGAESAISAGMAPRAAIPMYMNFNGSLEQVQGQTDFTLGIDHLTAAGWTAGRHGGAMEDMVGIYYSEPTTSLPMGVLHIPAGTVVRDEWAWYATRATNSIFAVRLLATGTQAEDLSNLRGVPANRDSAVSSFVQDLKNGTIVVSQYEADVESELRRRDLTVEDLQTFFRALPSPPTATKRAPMRRAAMAAASTDAWVSLDVDLWGVSIYFSHQAVTDIKNGTGVEGTIQKLLETALKSAEIASEVLTAIGGPAGQIAAAVLALKAAEMSLADRGSGVWVPITWLQLPTIPFPGMAAAWIHPFPAEWAPEHILAAV